MLREGHFVSTNHYIIIEVAYGIPFYSVVSYQNISEWKTSPIALAPIGLGVEGFQPVLGLGLQNVPFPTISVHLAFSIFEIRAVMG